MFRGEDSFATGLARMGGAGMGCIRRTYTRCAGVCLRAAVGVCAGMGMAGDA